VIEVVNKNELKYHYSKCYLFIIYREQNNI